MRLEFVYMPVPDLDAAIAFYTDLGFQLLFNEEGTAAVRGPGTRVALMLDEGPQGTVAPFFVVPDVRAFYEQNRERLSFSAEPRRISPGWLAAFTDPAGHTVRVMDRAESAEER